MAATPGPFVDFIKRLFFRLSGFNRYGLYFHDVLYEYPHVAEAVRRLPDKIIDERNFRIQRALQLSVNHTYLPREEWVSYDEDREKGRYMQPYLDEVLREMKEKAQWDKH